MIQHNRPYAAVGEALRNHPQRQLFHHGIGLDANEGCIYLIAGFPAEDVFDANIPVHSSAIEIDQRTTDGGFCFIWEMEHAVIMIVTCWFCHIHIGNMDIFNQRRRAGMLIVVGERDSIIAAGTEQVPNGNVPDGVTAGKKLYTCIGVFSVYAVNAGKNRPIRS